MGIEESIGDAVNKGKDLFEQNKEKVEEALKSDKAEEISDKIIGGVADFAKKIIPGEHHDKIDDVAEKLDKSVGND
ncbi:hypothetical protein [Microbacterium sp. No. 7]|uniref:hypothetical protein n=1 Tax=Microbacterium sp. No. 7 TaxID=1714373 RepID=UPI0006D278A7|nr:hypothetical protein [Microbacterium sp. No. 7]ALJ18992.1 hypothetical protein AOA12_03340 [Microbacterium sp. No. 7]